jgi:hypothetical protein
MKFFTAVIMMVLTSSPVLLAIKTGPEGTIHSRETPALTEPRVRRRRAKKGKSPEPEPEPSTNPTGSSNKKGLIIGLQVESQDAVDHFNGSVSWFYNYKHTPIDWQGDWANENDVEFIPMIPGPWLWDDTGKAKKCLFDETQTSKPVCTLDEVIGVLWDAKNATSNGVEIKSLMGFNEMYNNPPPIGTDLTPQESALYWGRFVQPAAKATDLELISPTLNAKTGANRWFADFLKACYDLRDDGDDSCDIELIKKFALHQYDCRESTWQSWYGGENSAMITGLIENLGDYGGKTDWPAYVRGRGLWVTETNCYWEEVDPTPDKWQFEFPHPNSKEQCLRITGQMQATHGMGSVAKMDQMDNIERYSLWTTWNKQIKPNYLAYKSGKLTPLGQGYLNIGDTSVDCEFPGTRINATDADLGGNAELFDCLGTGTKMVK